MTADAVLVGEIAHIEGALPTSARFNENMTNEQRRGYENLLLMCGTHHTIIDEDRDTWTVAKLRDLKRSHEAIYTAAVDKLRQQVGDVTEGVTYTPATNGLAILDTNFLNADERAESCAVINEFAERLTKVPADARSLLALVVARGDEIPTGWDSWSSEFKIPVPVLRSLADCSATKLRQHAEVLEHFDLLYRDDEPFDGPPVYVVGNSTLDIGWALLHDIRNAACGDHATIRRILCDLDFSLLDQ